MSKVYLAIVDSGHAGLKNDLANPAATPGKETPFIKALGRRIQEEEFNEPTARLLIAELKRCGVNVVDASPGEGDTPLKDRTTYANQIYWQYCNKYGKANVVCIYVSIHFNALDGKFEGADPSGFSVHIDPGSIEGRKLAAAVIVELKNGTKQINRGIVEQNLYVTKNTVMPAILTENGFMDNEAEANLMLSKNFQTEVAVEHAKGICEYMGIPYVAANVPKKPVEKAAEPPKPTTGGKHLSADKSFIKGQEWAIKNGVSDGTYPHREMARQEHWEMLRRYDEKIQEVIKRLIEGARG